MSFPQRLLPTGMDEKAPRMAGPFPFSMCSTTTPSTMPNIAATSSPSSVFPQMPLFPANLQHVYNTLLQNHLMHLAQQQQFRLSAVNSDQASSRSESPSNKKLILDEDGCATCPMCNEKLTENEWNGHVDLEKQRLVEHITLVKENVQCHSFSESYQQLSKRESELQRIRTNQQKRQILKRGPLMRDCLTPFSRQSNDETGSSESPDTKKEEEFSMLKCSSCSQPCAYAIIMSSFDRPKCQMCFDIIRTRSCILNTTSPSPAQEENEHSPVVKKMKLEVDSQIKTEIATA